MPTCGSADDPRRPDMSFAYVDEYLREPSDKLRALPQNTMNFVWENLSPELRKLLREKMGKKWKPPKS